MWAWAGLAAARLWHVELGDSACWVSVLSVEIYPFLQIQRKWTAECLDFSWKQSFGGFYTKKQELLPAANSRSTCPSCLASMLLRGCTFQECVALGGRRYCPQALSLLVVASLSFPPRWAGNLSVSVWGWRLWVDRGCPTAPLPGDNVSLNQLMKDNWKENKSSWYFGIRSFLNFLLVLEAIAVPDERWCLVGSHLSASFSPPPGVPIWHKVRESPPHKV